MVYIRLSYIEIDCIDYIGKLFPIPLHIIAFNNLIIQTDG
ncbi:protein of unknown function [Methanocaldococcus lauensis]|nr:protein of unknown function [Methanocaldococcus lauensis]